MLRDRVSTLRKGQTCNLLNVYILSANIFGIFESKFWILFLTPQLRMFFVFQPIESSVLNKLRNESGEKKMSVSIFRAALTVSFCMYKYAFLSLLLCRVESSSRRSS